MASDFQVHLKQIGATRARREPIGELRLPLSFTTKSWGPLASGSLAFDRASGYGGLPRDRIVTVTSTTADRARRFVYTVIGTTQEHGGRVAVIDLAAEFSPATTAKTSVEYADLALAQVKTQQECIEVVRELVGDRGYDLLVVNAPSTSPSARTGDLLTRLGQAAAHRFPALLVNLGRAPGDVVPDDPNFYEVELFAAQAPKSHPGVLESVVRMEGASDRIARLTQSARGRSVAVPETFQLALDSNLIVQTGNRYSVADGPDLGIGRIQAMQTISNRQDLLEGLRVDFEMDALADRLEATAEPPISASPLPKSAEDIAVADETPDAGGELEYTDTEFLVRGRGGGDDTDGDIDGGDEAAGDERGWDGGGPVAEDDGAELVLSDEDFGDEDASDEAGGRFVNTWFECDRSPVLPLILGALYEFRVQIGARQQREAGVATPLETEPDFSGRSAVPLLAALVSSDFEIAISSRELLLPRTHDSDVVSFAVSPRRGGTAKLRLLLSTRVELELLQEIEVVVNVVRAAQPVGV